LLFNSYSFLLFFPAVAFVLFLLPHRIQWAWLLSASVFFYACWSPPHLALIAVVIASTFLAAKLLSVAKEQNQKKLILAGALVVCLGQLFVFKYYNFAVGSVAQLLDQGWIGLKLILPVGISFYTFHAMSYVVDVYRGKFPVERHLGHYSLFVLYFPLLLAGPIERPGNLLHQIKRKAVFNPSNAVIGLRYILWGMFKKVAVADVLAPYVERVYSSPHDFTGPPLALATLLFAFQIYCDFSGYSDIAVGCAKIMGVDLTKNFDRPYFSPSISEFWRRWHVSLSTWFRDYVYVPLGGNRGAIAAFFLAVVVTFLLSGVWHGANWTFVVWGLAHGIAVFVSHKKAKSKSTSVLATIFTFTFVCLAWVLFRAENLRGAWEVFSGLVTGWAHIGSAIAVPVPFPTTGIVGVGLILVVHLIGKTDSLEGLVAKLPRALRWAFYYTLIFWTAWFGAYGGDAFIYFQF